MSARGTSKLAVPPHERLIVALDVETGSAALELVDRLGDAVDFYKLGWELLLSGDYFELIEALSGRYHKLVFADLKVHEIPATTRRAIRNLQRFHPALVTVHAQDAASLAEACREKGRTKILGVTVLTSVGDDDLRSGGIEVPVAELVIRRARAALGAGCDGVVASGAELELLRGELGDDLLIVVPGIRDEKSAPDDQKRVATVEDAFGKGADYVVVGRDIRDAEDPRERAQDYQRRIAALFVR